MAQKVQILAALAHTPDLIILDEPFSGLDPVNQQDLEQLIREEHARGATIVFSTHVMEHAERLCDRLLIIGAGKKCFDGTIDEALSLIPESALLTLETDMDLSSTLESRGFKATRLETTDIGVNWRVDFPNGGAAQDVLRADQCDQREQHHHSCEVDKPLSFGRYSFAAAEKLYHHEQQAPAV